MGVGEIRRPANDVESRKSISSCGDENTKMDMTELERNPGRLI